MGTWVYSGIENMKLSFSPTVNPTKALVSPVRAGNLASGAIVSVSGRMCVTLQDESFHQASLLLWPCHLGKQMILMRDGSLSTGTKHTHCSHCATLSLLPPGSHRHRSLCKHTHTVMDKDRYAMTWDGLTAYEFLMLHHEEASKTLNFQQVVMQQTIGGRLFCCCTVC